MKKFRQPQLIIAGVLIIVLVIIFGCLLFLKSPLADNLNITAYIKHAVLPGISNPSQCSDEGELTVLMTAIDQRSQDYLYGLADVIRLVHIDFRTSQVNVVSLPRALLVNVPQESLKVEGPILLNQAYFFGSPGMNYFEGSGYGAGSLAETIAYNFDIRSDQYVVIDFHSFVQFVDAIGGIEVDLPTYVDDMPSSYFPAGKQTLDGAQALTLARVRSKYSDLIRIDNQTIVMKAIFDRLKNPVILLKLPNIYEALKDSFISDASADQISNLVCQITKTKAEDVHFYNPPPELISSDWAFIPNMNQQMEIFRWDQRLTEWINQSLYAKRAE
jgi:LCP family protein required for cell wall assembly